MLAALAFGLPVVGYLGLAAGGYIYYKFERELHAITPLDTLLPTRWANVRAASGAQLINAGLEHAHAGRFPEALHHINAGLRKAPSHRDGRLAAAELRIAFQRPDAATALLLEGLPLHRTDAHYLSATFRFLLNQQRDDEVIDLGKSLLGDSAGPLPPSAIHVCLIAGATASFHRGNYDAAEDFLRQSPEVARSLEGQLLETKIDWECGYRELSLLRLRTLCDREPTNSAAQHELVARLHQSGLLDEARRRAIAFQIANPTLGSARVDLLNAYHETGDLAGTARECDLILRDFPRDRATLLRMAEFASQTGQPDLARRVVEHIENHKLPSEPFRFLRIEALLAAREYPQAILELRVMREQQSWSEVQAALLDSLQAAAYLGSGDSAAAKTSLNSFLQCRFSRTENLIAVANRFVALDAAPEACRILAHAIHRDGKNQAALARLIELELILNRIDELPPHLEALVAMRKPSPDLLRVAHHKLGSDLFLFSTRRDTALDAVGAALERSQESMMARR